MTDARVIWLGEAAYTAQRTQHVLTLDRVKLTEAPRSKEIESWLADTHVYYYERAELLTLLAETAVAGDHLQIAESPPFDPKLALKTLKAWKSEHIGVSWTERRSPVVFDNGEGTKFACLAPIAEFVHGF